jgi:hypothetical protein
MVRLNIQRRSIAVKQSTKQTRRVFMLSMACAIPALTFGAAVQAEMLPAMVDERERGAQGLGYRADATRVDRAHFPRYAAGQECANCTFYHGRAADPAAPCALFSGRKVEGKGWCAGYSQRA